MSRLADRWLLKARVLHLYCWDRSLGPPAAESVAGGLVALAPILRTLERTIARVTREEVAA